MPLRALSSELQRKAENELNEVPERIPEDLQYIEEWLTKQPHLNVRQDRQWLLSFLRNSKFSLERAKEKLDFFYTMKSITPEYFLNKDPLLPEIQEVLNRDILIPIQNSGMATILLVNWENADPSKVSFTNLFKTAMMFMDVFLNEDDDFSVCGLRIVHDMRRFSLRYVTQLTPALCKKAVLTIQNAYPSRLKGLYFIHIPAVYETFVNMFKPFFSQKLRSRLMVCGEGEPIKMYDEIVQNALPKEYGGEGRSIHDIRVEWKKKMEAYRGWFLEDAQYISDETKRPGQPITSSDIFGVEGSFRKLEID